MKNRVRNFHQAKWDEPIIFELSRKGERGLLVPEVEQEIEALVGDGISIIPENMRRKQPPQLPDIPGNPWSRSKC
jgi:glycine dehydrogenase subunit 2